MKKSALTIIITMMLIVLPQVGYAQKEVKSRTKGTLEVNTALLNMWGDQPDAINEMYRAAYNVLAEDPENTYEYVSKNEGVQKIWKENGRVHFGGPMLGNMKQSEAIRNRKPGAMLLGGRTGPAPTKPEWDTQFYGISGRYAFGEFEFDTSIPAPTVTFRLIGDDGSFIHELKLTKVFYSPTYRTQQEREFPVPDIPKTIHWDPDIKVDSNGVAHVSFNNSAAFPSIITDVLI